MKTTHLNLSEAEIDLLTCLAGDKEIYVCTDLCPNIGDVYVGETKTTRLYRPLVALRRKGYITSVTELIHGLRWDRIEITLQGKSILGVLDA